MSRDTEARWSDLMRAANGGDGAAYRLLLSELAPRLRQLAAAGLRRAGAGNGDVEDVVQEVLLAVHLKRHTWDPEQPLTPWLNAITRHKVLDALRRRRPSIDLDTLGDVLAAAPEPDTTEAGDARRLVAALKGRQREVVEAVSLDGASIREAAQGLGMSEGAVRVALHRGIAALARLYGRGSGGETP